MNSAHISIKNQDATRRFAGLLGGLLEAGDVLLLEGDLGAGKSALARAIIQTMPDTSGRIVLNEEVPSPTFTIVQTYEREVAEVWHFDLYRLSDAEELYEIGIEEALANHISLIEWPDRLAHLKPLEFLEIVIGFGTEEEARALELSGTKNWRSRLETLAAFS